MPDSSAVYRYHDGTKHHFNRFARSLGYLDWASQPHPFRTFQGSPAFPLWPRPDAPPHGGIAQAVGDLLRHSLGLSAWKAFQGSRWSLRVNPSSGNLHPTEAYVMCGAAAGLASTPAVFHYAADRHELELRCAFEPASWSAACGGSIDVVLIALTSIHWREAWKYGERAFRYCQHDLGHAIAAVSIAAALAGWRARMLPAWSHSTIAALTGLERDADFVDAEREEPGCLFALTAGEVPEAIWSADEALVAAVRAGRWTGRASRLSEAHVQWTFIDDVADATRQEDSCISKGPGRPDIGRSVQSGLPALSGSPDLRSLILRRRSAVAFDGVSSIGRETFLSLLASVMPDASPPWDALWWTPRIHLAIFVHRVNGVDPGLYVLPRRRDAGEALRRAMSPDFPWEPSDDRLPLFRLARGDCRRLAQRLSCDQAIAADGFFSLGMLSEFAASLDEFGPAFYRHLFWEAGAIGQVLYLSAEAAGARATGIGCFYDDPVHDLLGLSGHALQSLYHFAVGAPVEDRRLTTSPGYGWEQTPTRRQGW